MLHKYVYIPAIFELESIRWIIFQLNGDINKI